MNKNQQSLHVGGRGRDHGFLWGFGENYDQETLSRKLSINIKPYKQKVSMDLLRAHLWIPGWASDLQYRALKLTENNSLDNSSDLQIVKFPAKMKISFLHQYVYLSRFHLFITSGEFQVASMLPNGISGVANFVLFRCLFILAPKSSVYFLKNP